MAPLAWKKVARQSIAATMKLKKCNAVTKTGKRIIAGHSVTTKTAFEAAFVHYLYSIQLLWCPCSFCLRFILRGIFTVFAKNSKKGCDKQMEWVINLSELFPLMISKLHQHVPEFFDKRLKNWILQVVD